MKKIAVLLSVVGLVLLFSERIAFGQQKALGGDAVFPTEYYQKWQAAQRAIILKYSAPLAIESSREEATEERV